MTFGNGFKSGGVAETGKNASFRYRVKTETSEFADSDFDR